MGLIRNSKFKRPENIIPIAIKDKQLAIVDAVYRFGYLTNAHLETLLKLSHDSVKNNTKKLYYNKYLLRPRCQRNPSPWHCDFIYHMTSNRGGELLRQEKEYFVPKSSYDEKESQDSIRNWKHDSTQADFLVKLFANVRDDKDTDLLFPLDMIEAGIVKEGDAPWKPRNWERITWDTGTGRVTPDEVIMFRNKSKNLALVPIEIDMGTEAIERFLKKGSNIKTKLEKYIEVYQRGMHTDVYGVKNMRVLFITTSKQRIHNMIGILEKIEFSQRIFLFTTHKKIAECENILDLALINNRKEKAYLTKEA